MSECVCMYKTMNPKKIVEKIDNDNDEETKVLKLIVSVISFRFFCHFLFPLVAHLIETRAHSLSIRLNTFYVHNSIIVIKTRKNETNDDEYNIK